MGYKTNKKTNEQASGKTNSLTETAEWWVPEGEKGQKEHEERKEDRIHGDGEWLDSGW